MSRPSSVRLLLQGIRRVKAAPSSSSSKRGYPPFQNLCHRTISTIPPPTAKRLEGKMAIIIGAASGIGETTARLFAAHGARVLIADVQNAQILAKELGNGSEFIQCDVRNEEQVAAAVDKGVLMGEGKVDVFHHNAGILGAVGPIDETRMDEFDYTMAVNIRGAFLGVKHAARVMKPSKKGSIICTGSVAGSVGGLGPHAYTICKTALVGLVRSACVELRGFGIRVNMMSPDGVPTNILAQAVHMLEDEPISLDLAEKKANEFSPLPDRSLNTLDVAQAALFFATEDSGFISGHNLLVDCGNTITKPYDNARWYTTHSPLFREASKTGMD